MPILVKPRGVDNPIKRSYTKFLSRNIAITSLFFSSAIAYAQTAKEAATKIMPSVVILEMQNSEGKVISSGSGFIIKQGIIATNFHVIKGGVKGTVKTVVGSTKGSIDGVIAIDERQDLALVKVSGIYGSPVTIASSDVTDIGETVYAVGNPEGLQGTFSQGIVSGIRLFRESSSTAGTSGSLTVPIEVPWEKKLIQITAPISAGSSGGPIVDSKGNVVGVAVATFTEGQNLNFAVPISYLKNLITNPVVPLTSLNKPVEASNFKLPPPTGNDLKNDHLKGLKNITLLPLLAYDALSSGFKYDDIQKKYDSLLAENNIKTISPLKSANAKEFENRAFLVISIHIIDNAFHISVELQEAARLERNYNIQLINTTIWRRSLDGMHFGSKDYIYQKLNDLVQKFCDDYTKANT